MTYNSETYTKENDLWKRDSDGHYLAKNADEVVANTNIALNSQGYNAECKKHVGDLVVSSLPAWNDTNVTVVGKFADIEVLVGWMQCNSGKSAICAKPGDAYSKVYSRLDGLTGEFEKFNTNILKFDPTIYTNKNAMVIPIDGDKYCYLKTSNQFTNGHTTSWNSTLHGFEIYEVIE